MSNQTYAFGMIGQREIVIYRDDTAKTAARRTSADGIYPSAGSGAANRQHSVA